MPPYNKESNIKKEIKEAINLKLYKSWIIKNIFSLWYQNFVLGLFKTHVDKTTRLQLKSNIIDDDEEEKNDKLIKKII